MLILPKHCFVKNMFYFAVSCCNHLSIHSAQYVYYRAVNRSSLSYLPYQGLSLPDVRVIWLTSNFSLLRPVLSHNSYLFIGHSVES